jgi:hypothetical protein
MNEINEVASENELGSDTVSSPSESPAVNQAPILENGLLKSIYSNFETNSADWIALKKNCNALGFNIKKYRLAVKNKTNNVVDTRTLACSKAGKTSDNNKNGCDCPWRMNVKLRGTAPNQYWECILHNATHNHDLMPPEYVKLLGANREIPPEMQSIIRQLCESCYGVSISTMYSLLPVMYPDVDTSTYTKIDMQNLMTSIRNENRTQFDAQRLIDELRQAQREDPEFYFNFKVNGNNILLVEAYIYIYILHTTILLLYIAYAPARVCVLHAS